jgi:SAM-dependent methyltransferase
MKFDQAVYWARRGETYRAEFERHSPSTEAVFAQQEAEIARALAKHHMSDVRSILEVGCGFGRLTPLLLERLPRAQSYLGLDVSAGQVRAAEEAWEGDLRGTFQVGDFRSVPLERSDLVFLGEVLLHFPPSEIAAVVARAVDLAEKWLIHLDPYRRSTPAVTSAESPPARVRSLAVRIRGERQRPATDWQHDYPRLYDNRTVTMHPILGGQQHLFVVDCASSAAAP